MGGHILIVMICQGGVGNIEVEIQQPDAAKNEYLVIALSGKFENIAVSATFTTEAEVTLIFKFKKSSSITDVKYPDVTPIYNLKGEVSKKNKDINSSIVVNPLHIFESVWGEVKNNPPAWGTDKAAQEAIYIGHAALVTIAAWALAL